MRSEVPIKNEMHVAHYNAELLIVECILLGAHNFNRESIVLVNVMIETALLSCEVRVMIFQ